MKTQFVLSSLLLNKLRTKEVFRLFVDARTSTPEHNELEVRFSNLFDAIYVLRFVH